MNRLIIESQNQKLILLIERFVRALGFKDIKLDKESHPSVQEESMSDEELVFVSEEALAEEWLGEDEDEAWKDL